MHALYHASRPAVRQALPQPAPQIVEPADGGGQPDLARGAVAGLVLEVRAALVARRPVRRVDETLAADWSAAERETVAWSAAECETVAWSAAERETVAWSAAERDAAALPCIGAGDEPEAGER